jgi:hypothetical protein
MLGRRLAERRTARYPLGAMMRSLTFAVLVLGGALMSTGPAAAADLRASGYSLPAVVGPHPPLWRYNARNRELPFARSARAQAVWDAGACRSECAASCAWAFNSCLYEDAQGHCLAYTDACDRYCQRSCRSYSGPLLPIE